jgi:hypothetical protein
VNTSQSPPSQTSFIDLRLASAKQSLSLFGRRCDVWNCGSIEDAFSGRQQIVSRKFKEQIKRNDIFFPELV